MPCHRLTLGAFVRPEIPHSLTSRGESIDVTFAFSRNGSLMMFTVNCFVFLMLSAVSFRPPSESEEIDTETSGGDCVTWLNQLPRRDHDQRGQDPEGHAHPNCVGVVYLNGARFSTPLSETDETNAMGRGMIPLIMSAYYEDTIRQSYK